MDFPILFDTISMGLPILYFKGSQGNFLNVDAFSVLEGCFNLSKRCRPWGNAALCCISSGSSLFAEVPV